MISYSAAILSMTILSASNTAKWKTGLYHYDVNFAGLGQC